MMMDILYVSVGGLFGAIGRYAFSRFISLRNGFPIATLIVNLLGAFLLGIITGTSMNSQMHLLFGVGFMGAFTTFSTLNLEADQLDISKKALYLLISYVPGLFLAYVGILLGKNL